MHNLLLPTYSQENKGFSLTAICALTVFPTNTLLQRQIAIQRRKHTVIKITAIFNEVEAIGKCIQRAALP